MQLRLFELTVRRLSSETYRKSEWSDGKRPDSQSVWTYLRPEMQPQICLVSVRASYPPAISSGFECH